MHDKLINSSRRKFNKIFIFNLISLLTLNLFLYKKDFLNPYSKKNRNLKWILSKNDL